MFRRTDAIQVLALLLAVAVGLAGARPALGFACGCCRDAAPADAALVDAAPACDGCCAASGAGEPAGEERNDAAAPRPHDDCECDCAYCMCSSAKPPLDTMQPRRGLPHAAPVTIVLDLGERRIAAAHTLDLVEPPQA